MHIVYHLDSFPKLSEKFVVDEIRELRRRGHDVAVCHVAEPSEEFTYQNHEKLDIHVHSLNQPTYDNLMDLFSAKLLRPRVLRHARYTAPPTVHAANLHRARQCIEFVESLEWTPDHVHSHFATRSTFAAKYVAAYFDASLTVTAHAFDIFSEPVGSYTTTLFEAADRVVTISDYNKAYIRERFTTVPPVDVVRAGIRPDEFVPTETTVPGRVLTTARLVEKKGIEYALEAVEMVAQHIPEIEYHVIGTGELKDDLRKTVARLGIEDQVTFLGTVSRQRLLTELDEARCFLLPCVIADSGDRDGIPVALMEAMAMRTPPISTNISGIPELIDHEENGLLVEPRNSERISDAVRKLLTNDTAWTEYAGRARERISCGFDVRSEARKLEATFRATIE